MYKINVILVIAYLSQAQSATRLNNYSAADRILEAQAELFVRRDEASSCSGMEGVHRTESSQAYTKYLRLARGARHTYFLAGLTRDVLLVA